MGCVIIEIIPALVSQLQDLTRSEPKIHKLFHKQKQFMELHPYYPSLGRKKLINVFDQYGQPLEEIRLNSY